MLPMRSEDALENFERYRFTRLLDFQFRNKNKNSCSNEQNIITELLETLAYKKL